jgi:hypothetical protein
MKPPRRVPRPCRRAVVVEAPEIRVAETHATAAPEAVQDTLRLLIRWTLRSMGRDPACDASRPSMHLHDGPGDSP